MKIYCGGKIKSSPFEEASAMYLKRIHLWPVQVHEMEEKQWTKLAPTPNSVWIALDERGKNLSSAEFYKNMISWNENYKTVAFFVGESDGLPPLIADQSQHKISFGSMTWPHLLARVLLLEQIYRAQQRGMNHPYSFV